MSDTRECPFCAEEIKVAAIKCKHCGEFFEKPKENGAQCSDCGTLTSLSSSFCPGCGVLITDAAPGAENGSAPMESGYKPHSKTAAALLALFLGGLGFHKFYLGKAGLGLLYLFTCWTLVPAIAGLIEGLNFILMSQETFDERYNCEDLA